MAGATVGKDSLVTEALMGVLEIAWDGQDADALDGLRRRAARLPLADKERLLDGLIRIDEVGTLLRTAAAGRLEATGIAKDLEPWQDKMVSAALEPLSELTGIPKGRDVVNALPPPLRAEILLRAVNNAAPSTSTS